MSKKEDLDRLKRAWKEYAGKDESDLSRHAHVVFQEGCHPRIAYQLDLTKVPEPARTAVQATLSHIVHKSIREAYAAAVAQLTHEAVEEARRTLEELVAEPLQQAMEK